MYKVVLQEVDPRDDTMKVYQDLHFQGPAEKGLKGIIDKLKSAPQGLSVGSMNTL